MEDKIIKGKESKESTTELLCDNSATLAQKLQSDKADEVKSVDGKSA